MLDVGRIARDSAYRYDLRQRCFRDHFFLARLMGFHDFVERIHRPAVDLYFPKNPSIPIRDQHPIKKRMHLDPRGTFKTTLGRVDSMQWLVAFSSDITILNETATQPLAEAISLSIAKYFYQAKGMPSKPLHLLFPELVVQRMPKGMWDAPNRQEAGAGDLDKTLAFTSPQSTQSGWHPWVINPDDMVDTENSGMKASPEVRKNVIVTYRTNAYTLRPGGYVNMRGTRYHPFDLYGDVLGKINKDDPEADGWKLLIRAAATVNDGKRLLPGEFPAEENMVINFPELPGMDYKSLRTRFLEDYETAMCQDFNDPQGGSVARFDEKLYRSCLIAPERIPFGGEIYIAWRTRYGGKKSMARYSEGAVAKVVDGKIYVLDCFQGTYTPSGEAEKIVHQAKVHQADALMLVYVPGTEYLWTHIRNEAARRNRSLKMQWTEFEEDDARRIASMEQLEPMMKVGRVWFSTAMTKAMECQNQFVHFGLMEEQGIVEAVSKFADLVPLSQMRANMSEEEMEWQRRRHESALVNTFLEQQGMNMLDEQLQQKAAAHLDAMSSVSNFTMPTLPGGHDG
ncbi:MAG: hypothetical protein WBQ94_04430 [Terracidiphilus sp.]